MSHIQESLPAAQPHASGKIQRICRACGKTIFIKLGEANKGRGWFCGWDCFSPPMTLKERFLSHLLIGDGCWEWVDSPSQKYPVMTLPGRKRVKASRMAYELFIGPMPKELWALHRCDNPRCARPDHIFPGTCQDNCDDAGKKGRRYRGEQCHTAKMTEDDVREIRRLQKLGWKRKHIAKHMPQFSSASISHLMLGKTWKHVTDSPSTCLL